MSDQNGVLLKMSEQLGSLTARVESQDEKLERIEKGVEELKGWKAKITGMAAVVGALVSVGVTWLSRQLTIGGGHG